MKTHKKGPPKETQPKPLLESNGVPQAVTASFPVVGIGASAGGLAAFEAFFSGLPTDKEMDMAFVLVQHLAPDHKSLLTELVKRYTRMNVFEVVDGIRVEPNCAYIIPPNKDMAFLNGTLQLLEPGASRGHRLPIDFFFRSLAQDLHDRSICIVLSGTGSDGARGLRHVKDAGGMVMAQNPESTEFDGMPRSAIATGLVDFVLPPAEMAAQLTAYVARAPGRRLQPAGSTLAKCDDSLNKIYVLLRAQTGHDFSQYKRNTICRRIERRMAVQQIEHLEDYVRLLRDTPDEAEALFRDFLIGVTQFFRDPEAFAALQKLGIQAMFAAKGEDEPIRIWVPGCSTGEEAYSIAMLLREHADNHKQPRRIRLFATDIDHQAIELARAGCYPASIANDVSPERLERFFQIEDDGATYRIVKGVRDLIVFSDQNVTRDPPFSRLDLISCRNLLIYMGGDLQKKLIPLFHYALNPGGVLFQGTSESIGEFSKLFDVLDRKWKIYRSTKNAAGVGRQPVPPLAASHNESRKPGPSFRQESKQAKPSLRDRVERTLLEEVSPAAALVNSRGDIQYLHGRTGKYLEPASGDPNMNILKMAREGLRHDLTTALHLAAAKRELVRYPGLRVKTNGDYTRVHLTVRPLVEDGAAGGEQDAYLVVLQEATHQPTDAHEGEEDLAMAVGSSADIAALHKELRAKDEFLQSTVEEMETANEELKSSNEELQSTNEELQSAIEELETSKEELQSLNEELATVNAELQTKLAELSRANNDMNNLMAGTDIGTIYVDHQLRIQRFTPSIGQVTHLIQADIGRPVGHIASKLVGYDRLAADAMQVLNTLVPMEVEVEGTNARWYLQRIRPYRTLENVIEGAVITYTEITEVKKAKDLLRESDALRRLGALVRDAHDAMVMLDMKGNITAWNPGATRLYGWCEEAALTKSCIDLVPEGQRSSVLDDIRRLAEDKKLDAVEAQRMTECGETILVSMTATLLVDDAGAPYAISLSERLLPPQHEEVVK